MASISKIRYTNVIYENGSKRYNDELFKCAGHNTAILLENGGGKTVFIQAALQAVLPHMDLGERKVKETFSLEGEAAHIAIEWIIQDKPRRYGLTAVTLYLQNNELKSYKYAYEYGVDDKHSIENLPFTQPELSGGLRASSKGEMNEYYQRMSKDYMTAQSFQTTRLFHDYIEEHFKIIAEEWRSIAVINSGEGSVEAFFDGCKTTQDLVEKLLLPTVEQGLVGSGSDDFTSTFESQREHFKKHKQLTRSIEESKKIKEEMDKYVKNYSVYAKKIEDYTAKKEEAKALWELVEMKEQEAQKELKALEQEQYQLKEEKELLEKQSKLIEVTEAKEIFEQSQKTYEAEDHLYQAMRHKREEKETRRHMLKLSWFKHNMGEAQAKIRVYEEQLALLNEDQEVEALKEALEENSCQLKGCFEDQLAGYKKEYERGLIEKERYEEDREVATKEKLTLEEEMKVLREKCSKLEGIVESQKSRMEAIKKTILSQGIGEDVEEQFKLWQSRISEIEVHELTLRQELKTLEEEQDTLNIAIEEKNSKRTAFMGEISRITAELCQLEEAGEKVLQDVKVMLPIFYSVTSIYAKPQQMLDTLEEQVERLTREKEDALLMERQHSRFLENYEDHEYFTAEPLIESFVAKWYSQFSFLQSGTDFIQSLEDEAVKERMQSQPRWTQLMIVADGQKEALRIKLGEQRQKITTPVGILTLTEAKGLLEEHVEIEQMIYPKAWQEDMQTEAFKAHKNEAMKALDEAIAYRKQKESKLRELDQLLNKIRNFLSVYPHEKYVALREQQTNLKAEEATLSRVIQQDKGRIEDIKKESKGIQTLLQKESHERNTLQSAVEKASEYLKLKQDNNLQEQAIHILQGQIKDQENLITKACVSLEQLKEVLDDIKERLEGLRRSQTRIEDDELYKEVKNYQADYSNGDLAYLRDKQIQLKESLNSKQKGRSEIEHLLEQSKKAYADNEKNFHLEEAEREEKLTEIPNFRVEYEEEINKLTKELNGLKKDLEDLEQKVKGAKTQFDKMEQDYHSKKENFEKAYEPISTFIPDCRKAREEEEKLQTQLKDKEQYIKGQSQTLEKQLALIVESKLQMDKKDQLYGYCAPEVKVGLLDEKIKEEVKIQLKRITTEMIRTLETLKSSMDSSHTHITVQRESFKHFCQREIRDSKLRNMAIQGITQKENYEDLIKWQDHMVERINHTLSILERDMIDQDKQLSQFITHLYTYLRTVVAELKEIPKKTRVKTEEGWKTIYEFDIPGWQEDEGKEKIRNHIYKMLDDIDHESFLDEDNEEALQKVKKYIKEQFKLKQLLKVVMGSTSIRIRCRKVSNISDISTQLFSWETSNKWSGGEKWSKNMALYLGILNYLAEKKQNIHSDNNKVSRVVILDNPFGKASSGHVLEPVFFIAKQLGFQIIALTAHTEGDFIRKYFPIVYSCKLRSTADLQTAIFTKEQEIKKAYFMDNDPVALSVLGETNQVSLF